MMILDKTTITSPSYSSSLKSLFIWENVNIFLREKLSFIVFWILRKSFSHFFCWFPHLNPVPLFMTEILLNNHLKGFVWLFLSCSLKANTHFLCWFYKARMETFCRWKSFIYFPSSSNEDDYYELTWVEVKFICI